jgi:serine protease Do
MRRAWSRVVVIVAVLGGGIGGAGTEARGQHSRRTPVVEAVQKTRAGVVSVKVEKSSSWGRKEIGGSGVVVDERGYVVTNRHVVASANRVSVYLADGTELAAELFADDARHDLAILRLGGARKLQALQFGPSADLLVGETVIAIGHPYGYANTVSTGIVSALGREVTMPGGEVLRDLIQVTASINPGNSGGPLLNINGELIGINVALREGAQGIAFALTADAVQQVLGRHLSAARVAGVSHGLSCAETTLAEDGPNRQRVIVQAAAGAAAAAGLKRGDALLKVGGRAVANRLDVERAFWDGRPGDEVALTVLRGGREASLTLTLARASELERAVVRTPEPSKPPVSYARPIWVEGPDRVETPPKKSRKP